MMNASRRPVEKYPNELIAHLRALAATRPADTALIVVAAEAETKLTYAELDRRVRAVAAEMQRRFEPGDRALLLLDNNEHYVVGFLACLYAGLIAVPAFPPESLREHHVARLTMIANDAQARCVVVSSDLLKIVGGADRLFKGMDRLVVDEASSGDANRWLPRVCGERDVVFLQYTSGSTAAPKGVIVAQGNLLANEHAISQALQMERSDVFVSWLPLFHDMGLVGGLFQPIYSGIPLVLMSPGYFLERPARWLELISRHRGTISGGPDFAYRLCLERITGAQIKKLDLSTWRVAFSGAEPVRHDTLQAFAERFKDAGFNPRAIYPCYGLAEATLLVTGGQRDSGMTVRTYSSERLAKGRAVTGKIGTSLVACGVPHSGHRVRIADPETGVRQPNTHVGEIWVSGPSVSPGYWRREEETAETFVERDGRRWLRTGDLGFVQHKQLYITGRRKDLIILRGHNVYPQDIERQIESEIEAVRKGRVAVFAVETELGEGIGVAAEVSRGLQKLISPERLFAELSQVVSAQCNEALSVAVLLNPGGLPKTSSGKVQRAACRIGWQEGTLDAYATLQNGVSRPESRGVADVEAAGPLLTPAQRRIGAIWAEILRVPEPAVATADFFALGGNSIMAAQVTARVSEEFSVRLEPAALLGARTISAFTELVEQAPRQQAPTIGRVARAEQLQPSAAQRRMWFLWQLEPDNAAYNVGGGLRLRGQLDVAVLQRTVDELVRRHEVLRTRFQQLDGVLTQHLDDLRSVAIDTVDLSGEPAEDRGGRIDTLLSTEFQRPFDLQRAPVLRVALLKLDALEHVLFVTTHHIAADGMSMVLLMEDLVRIYGALRKGQTPDERQLAVQYLDHAAWQEAEFEREGRERQLAYWTQRLGREYPDTSPRLDRPRPKWPDHRGERYRIPIDPSLMQGVRSLANAQGVTVFVVLLTAWKIVLARHSGHHDIRVGAPVANRRSVASESMVGPFVNTVVLRTDLDGNPSASELLRRVAQTVLEAQAHQELPFEQLVEALAADRTSSRHPLFQVMHNHQSRARTTFEELAPLQAEVLDGPQPITEFDLSLNTEEWDGQIRAALKYRTALYDESTVARIAGHWLNALQAMVAAPQSPLDEIQLLGPQEISRLLRAFNATTSHYADNGSSVHRLIERQVARSPDAEAVVFEGARCSYRELNRRANRLAWKLRGSGVGPDVLVGICSERCLDLAIGLLAILKAGGAYLPLDPAYPRSRLDFILDDSQPRVVLAGRDVLEKLPSTARSSAWLLDEEHSEQQRDDDLPGLTHPHNLAYCLYTSGSTGQPKCAANTHGALLNQMLWRQEVYGLREHDRVLHKTPIGFDVSVWEIFWPLMTGATLVLAAPGAHRDPWRLRAVIQNECVTTLHFVPPMLTAFIEAGELARCESLRRVFVGGQALAPATHAAFFQQCNAKLYNLYGPTEAAIDVTFWECDPETHESIIPMGRALANTQLYVLDHALAPVPVGVVGELYIAGAQLARGYAHRPGQTASKFLANPFTPGERLYRSGDLARYRPDGALEYVGRVDHQVKVRGFRIELEEIEARLREHPAVRDAVVLVVRDGFGESELVAHVVSSGVDSRFQQQLHDYLAQRLPDYMLPAHYAWLDALPLLSNGKVDRAALAAFKPVSARQVYAPPRTEIERRVAAIWGEVLEVENVGLHDSFFELGGHSLLATRAVSKIRAAFDIELPLRTLFEATRLGDFAEAVRKCVDEGVRSPFGQIEPVDRSSPLPLSHAQQRMWLLWQLDPRSVAYNLAGKVKLTGPLNYAAIEDTLRTLSERHEALRTTFRVLDGVPGQKIAAHVDIPVERVDLRALSDADRQSAVDWHADSEAHRPFDLQTGPLLRVLLLQLQDREHLMIVTTHHIVAEGWAIDVFAREFMALYQGFSTGRATVLSPLPVQYADYMHWHARWLAGGEQERQLKYWKNQLSGDHELLALPTDRPRPKVASTHGDVHRFVIEPTLAARLREFSTRHDLTLFMTLLAGFFALLHRYSRQSDINVGFPVANRVRPEAEGLIGAFLNMQVMRCRLSDATTFEQLLARIKEATIAGQSHQDVPFDRLVDAIKPPRGPGFHPLYQVMFNLHRWNFERRSQMGDVTIEVMPNDVRAAQLDLTLDVGDVGDGLECGVIYNTDLFDRATIERLSGYWIELLRAALERQDQRIGGIPLLSDSDRALLGACGVNDGGIFPGATSTEPVHRLFERQAEQRPNATALIVGADELSYAELNQRANRLAHRLIALGVKPEDCIGIAVERSADMLVGLLAVLKAGAAYVPLDPAHPLERIDYMIRDSGVSLLLTNSNVVERFSRHTACNTLLLDRPDWQDEPHRNPNVTLHSEHPAYTIYTSGSTGRPKGVQVRHGALGNFLLSMRDRPGFGADDRLVAVTSLSFDIAGLELYLPLIAGACVVLATEAEAHDGRLLAQLLEKHRATVLQATPSGWRLLLAAGWRGAGSAGLRALCGGEELQADLARQLRDMNVELWNMYGPTETTIWSSTGRVSDAAVSLGRPIAATQLHVLTGDLLPAAPGMPGELYIGGNGLARGYLRRAALSSERFIANPLSMNGERLYRTGDLVRWSAGGELQYLGRIDHQVKIRGFRIELAEIESRLLEQPEVREAVVAAKEGPVGARLVGYVSSNDGFAIEPSVLRDRIATLLPDYMVPSSLVVLERLPLNANGKVDRKALPAPDLSSYADEPPQGEIELTLARIWTDVLKVERVGRHDNFFEVGGDSILSLQIVTRAHSAGWKLAPKQLFEHRTIAALARVAERVEDCSSVEEMIRSDGPLLTLSQQQLEALPFSADQIEDVLPLTPMQEGMLLHTVLDPGSGMYLMQHRFTIESPIDQVAFWASWDAALHEHAALRAGFFWQAEAKPFQVIRREVDLPKQFLDLRELDQSAALSRIDAILSAELSAGFDMARAPLIGVRLAQLGTERFHVVVSFHHILMDAWCFALLVREVLAQYEFRTVGAQPPLQRPAPYRDFLVWLMRQDRAAALNHWRQVLAGIDEVTPLPMIRHVAAGSGGSRMVDLNTRLSAAQTAQLHAVASRYELTPNTLIQGAWALVLARYANSNDVVFGVTVAGKPAQLPDLERTVGLFINTIASRVVLPNPDDRVTVAQWLQTLFAQNTQAREFEHLPLTDIQASSGLSSQRRLFDSLFVFENAPVEAEVTRTAQRLLVTPHSVRTHTNYPVTIMIVPGAQCLLQITYDERFLDAEVAERLLNSFRLVIEQFIAAPAMALEQIRVLTDTQRQAIVAVGVGRSVEQPLERGYIDLFSGRSPAIRPVPPLVAASWRFATKNSTRAAAALPACWSTKACWRARRSSCSASAISTT